MTILDANTTSAREGGASSKASPQPRPMVANSGSLVGIDVTIIDAGSEERIALQID